MNEDFPVDVTLFGNTTVRPIQFTRGTLKQAPYLDANKEEERESVSSDFEFP